MGFCDTAPMDRHIIFKCPRTGLNVQHRLPPASDDDRRATYQSVVCAACSQLHFVNEVTGKLLGEK
jgi:hypothetical protein